MIDKEPQGVNQGFIRSYFTESCRNAMLQVYLSLFENSETPTVLLPAYIGLSKIEGSGVFDPIKESKIKYLFYKLDQELKPNLSDISNLMKKSDIDLFVVINYFGWRPSNYSNILKLMNDSGVKILEDNAHCLFRFNDYLNSQDMEVDYSVFSIHKFIAAKSGGILVVKNCQSNFLDTIAKPDLLAYSKAPINKIYSQRESNFKQIHKFFSQHKTHSFQPFFSRAEDNLLHPLNYPLRFIEKSVRHEFYLCLIENGIVPTSLYHQLIPELDQNLFPESVNIANTILNLPIHHEVGSENIDHMLSMLLSLDKRYSS
jgi:dTDP-4-amino-4,6-dideoxygalactose transaminase